MFCEILFVYIVKYTGQVSSVLEQTRISNGTRASPVCLHCTNWELITKLNLQLLLSMLPVVNQPGLISHIPNCCLCSPSTETYLAAGDSTQLQPAASSSSGRQLFQTKSPAFSGHLHYSSVQVLISPCGTSNSQARMWKQPWELKATLTLKVNGLTLLPVCT